MCGCVCMSTCPHFLKWLFASYWYVIMQSMVSPTPLPMYERHCFEAMNRPVKPQTHNPVYNIQPTTGYAIAR